MANLSVTQCNRSLDFQPRSEWAPALPAICWRGELVCGFDRTSGVAIDVFETNRSGLIDTIKACHPELGLAEIARLMSRLTPEQTRELGDGLLRAYGLRANERLTDTLALLAKTPADFQGWVDEKGVGARDLAPLLALPEPVEFFAFLSAMIDVGFSRSEGVRALELGTELFLMGRPLNDLLPAQPGAARYLRQLEQWRRPNASAADEALREDVRRWPWPAQVQADWQRFGDESGLEIKIRTTSAQDFNKKLERLLSIGNTWSCKS